MGIRRLTHLGICVSDLERSLRFYRDVLGCVEVGRLELSGEPTATLNGMADVRVRLIFLERDGWRLEPVEKPGDPAALPLDAGRRGAGEAARS